MAGCQTPPVYVTPTIGRLHRCLIGDPAAARHNSAPQGTVGLVPMVEHPAGDIIRGSHLKLSVARLSAKARKCPGQPGLAPLHHQAGSQSRLNVPLVISVPVSTDAPEAVVERGGLS